MNSNLTSQLGSFSAFGFTKSLAKLHEWSGRLGIIPRAIDFGDWGHLFFYSSYGDVEETEKVIALKLGFVRSPSGSPLSTQQLIDQKTLSPRTIDHQALRGNALVACLGKTEASFSVYQTLLSAYQLHYSASAQDFLCSDSLRCLVAMLGHVELNEDLVPLHFALLYVPGRPTLLRDVKRLLPGELLQWKEGKLDIHMAQDLRFVDNDRRLDHADDRTAAIVHERLGAVVGAYVDEVERSGRGGLGNLLSGGIDSSLLQLILNERSSHTPRSFSYAPTQAPHFEFEVEYARQASEAFGTTHEFVQITPDDFAGLLIRATDILAQPVITDPEPNKLGLAEYLQRNASDLHYFVNGLAAGSVFGNSNAPKVKRLEAVGKVPASKYALAAIGRLLKPFSPRGQTFLKAADMLAQADDPNSFITPINTQGTHKEFDHPRRFFGDEAVLKALRHRRELARQYRDSNHPIEKIHLITLLTHMYEVLVQSQRLFLALNKEQIFPFVDEDIIRLAFAFPPQVRYAPRFIDRYLFRKILTQKSSSTIAIGRKRKGGSSVFADLWTWMQSGRLHEMIREIELPGFLSRKEFEDLVQQPNWFLWSLLTFDLFQKRILKEGF